MLSGALRLMVPVRRLPVAHYADDSQLKSALAGAPTDELAWEFEPAAQA